jgi:hypothetical protein
MSIKKVLSQKDKLHHAYATEGDKQLFLTMQTEVQSAFGVDSAHPDFFSREYDRLSVEHAREIINQAHTRPLGEKKIFYMYIGSITREAENALLKTFEEPGEGIHFFIIFSDYSRISPIVKSRFMFITQPKTEGCDVSDFLSLSLPERYAYIEDMMTKYKKGTRTREEVVVFISSLARVKKSKQILECVSYASDTSASLKMILEDLAVLV